MSINSTVDISRSRFEDNRAADYGGAIFAEQDSIINMSDNVFVSNYAYRGGVLYSNSSTITIEASEFYGNNANEGGVLHSDSSIITIEVSKFRVNSASNWGGVLYSYINNVTIEESKFYDNSGGVLDSDSSNITIEASEFRNNSATKSGGVLKSLFSNITIEASVFYNNSQTDTDHDNYCSGGGVLCSSGSNIMIEASEFYDNYATNRGGVLASICSIITIAGSRFTSNVSPIGAIIYATLGSIIHHVNSFLLIDDNAADEYALIYLFDSEFIGSDSGNATFSSNLGSLVAFNSSITFTGYATFVNNTPSKTVSGHFQEGGAITPFQSSIFFYGQHILEHNHAINGGAIHSSESKLYVNGDVTIAHNTATGNGGGIYLSISELNCQQKSIFVLWNNTALHKGGGLHAISSFIKAASSFSMFNYSGARMNIIENAAEMGGGLSLEANTKFYILKYEDDYNIFNVAIDANTTIFTANSAVYGGAIYVNDDTNSGTCASYTKTECFFQVLALYDEPIFHEFRTQSMHFSSQNHANISGSNLYGGLLDRCTVSPFAEVRHNDFRGDGIAYLKNVSTPSISNLSVSSDPVRVCLFFNADQSNDCTYQYYTEVKKGQTFKLSVVAIDQIAQPVGATIQTSLHFTESGLAEGQLAKKIPAERTDLTFNLISPHVSESLSLYASDGPCKDTELSRATVEIHFLPCSCPIGLQVSRINSINCTCECHSNISQYVEYCDSHTGSLIKQPQTRAWISYINYTKLTESTPTVLLTTACQPVHQLTSTSQMEPMFSVPSIGHPCCADLANLVSVSLLVVHAVSHVLATGLYYS